MSLMYHNGRLDEEYSARFFFDGESAGPGERLATGWAQEGLGTVPRGSGKARSIAVLPFVDMSPGRDQDYFAEGIAEELLNALAHIEYLRVVARTSAFAFKGEDLDIREIGRKLDVKPVLEGSVRKAGNRLRITAQRGSRRAGEARVYERPSPRPCSALFRLLIMAVRPRRASLTDSWSGKGS